MYHYYERLLPELISSWRELFAVNFTALVVQVSWIHVTRGWRFLCGTTRVFFFNSLQLAAYGAVDPLPAQRTLDALPELRDTQYSALTLPGTGVSLAIDIGALACECGDMGSCHMPIVCRR